MAKHKLAYALPVAAMALGAGILTATSAFADWRGGVTENADGVVKAEVYVETRIADGADPEVSRPNAEDVGYKKPAGTVKVRKTVDEASAEIVGTYPSEDDGCFVTGKKVGKGVVICEYLDDADEVLQTAEVTVHVFADPNYTDEIDGGVQVLGGTSVSLMNIVGKYFDNPTEIKAAICGYDEEGDQAFTIEGNNLTDSVIKTNNITLIDTVCFYNPYSTGYNEGAAEMADGLDELAQLSVEVYKADAEEYEEDEEVLKTELVTGEAVITDDEKKGFEAIAGGDEILGYYDVLLVVKDEQDNIAAYIGEAGSQREVKIELPDDVVLPELADGYERVFYIIRDHNGVKDILPATDNGDGSFTFWTDKFSTFALAYYDVATNSNDDSAGAVSDSTETAAASTPETGTVTAAGASAMSAGIVTVAAVAVIATVAGVTMAIRRK